MSYVSMHVVLSHPFNHHDAVYMGGYVVTVPRQSLPAMAFAAKETVLDQLPLSEPDRLTVQVFSENNVLITDYDPTGTVGPDSTFTRLTLNTSPTI